PLFAADKVEFHGQPVFAVVAGTRDAARRAVRLARIDFEPEEPVLLDALGVRVFYAEEVRRRGLAAVIDEAVAHVSAGTAAFGVSLDLDSVDPTEAPGVGTPVTGGLTAADLVAAVGRVRRKAEPAAWEVVEFNPHRDRDGRTAELAMALLAAAVGAGRATPSEQG
ncbi:MAG: arginase family protein, partial [Alphaproteobacteria bacterium]